MKWFWLLMLILATGPILGCASGNCRGLQSDFKTNSPVLDKSGKKAASGKPTSDFKTETVRVYKYDGSLQCGQGTPLTPEEMSKELGEIRIFSKTKLSDNLVRIQQCGVPTGKANVFEINIKDLPEAVRLGFEKWTFSK